MEINIHNFNLTVKDKILIEDSSLLISGKKIQITGANGSGKTSLLKILYGYNKHYSGSILIDGQEINRLTKNYFSYIQQDQNLIDQMNISQNAYILNINYQKFLSYFNYLKPEIKLSKKICELSGGQKQALSIALGMAKESYCLLVDEPLNNLDSETQKKVIKLLNHDNRDQIIVSHLNDFKVDSSIKIYQREMVVL